LKGVREGKYIGTAARSNAVVIRKLVGPGWMIQVLGFPYSSLGAVSLVTYFTVGLMGAWRAHFRLGVIAAVIVGFLDATIRSRPSASANGRVCSSSSMKNRMGGGQAAK
jgi:hypothetical protein